MIEGYRFRGWSEAQNALYYAMAEAWILAEGTEDDLYGDCSSVAMRCHQLHELGREPDDIRDYAALGVLAEMFELMKRFAK